ncbi:Tat proofreading chaperone DmsD [Superficieibacter sp.]|uniref:Tat proofreading chaperone DmsD n=1 Tax=Superficieibacter sp. TaxID=2303322 RepID=UPI0028B03F3A|nr:Tat proofreading chaperone DmsD [Superficieibacter sp.]
MHESHQRDAMALTARVLGALFYYPPDSPDVVPLVEAFRSGEWRKQLPFAGQSEQLNGFAQESDETLPQAFQRLFVGPWALPAPPWGSVWLDRESVLFGDSTLALRQWMRENGIAFDATQNEPEDHVGTLLLLVAWLSENGQSAQRDQLLAWHLLPWAGRFLSQFVEHAAHPFYQALGQLAQITLAQWQADLLIPVAQKTLYR